jgi:hypothetical protein
MFTQIYDICLPLEQNNHAAGMQISVDDHMYHSVWAIPQKLAPYDQFRAGYIPLRLATGTGIKQPSKYVSVPVLAQYYPTY